MFYELNYGSDGALGLISRRCSRCFCSVVEVCLVCSAIGAVCICGWRDWMDGWMSLIAGWFGVKKYLSLKEILVLVCRGNGQSLGEVRHGMTILVLDRR
jgi:hypothetical protein